MPVLGLDRVPVWVVQMDLKLSWPFGSSFQTNKLERSELRLEVNVERMCCVQIILNTISAWLLT
jgi:hypothetical protein